MGSSPHGFVFWGIPLPTDDYGERGETPWEKHRAREFYAAKKGVMEPEKKYVSGDPDYIAYWQAKEALVQAEPCKISQTGYGDFERDIAYVKASYVEVEWSEVKPFSTEVNPEWEGQLRAFCEVMEIEWTEPGWYVGTRYG
jgi:hypothetical protein